jgi:hypothetical protein
MPPPILPLTPEDIAVWWLSFKGRFQDWNDIPPESVIVALIEQLGLNQRMAYEHEAWALTPPSQSPAPNGEPHTPAEQKAGQPGPEARKDDLANARAGAQAVGATPPAPKTPSGDGNTPKSEIAVAERIASRPTGPRKADVSVPATPEGKTATVENLSPYLGDYNTLPRAAFEVWRSFGKPYPPTSTTRLQALRALTPEQLGQLLEACKL